MNVDRTGSPLLENYAKKNKFPDIGNISSYLQKGRVK